MGILSCLLLYSIHFYYFYDCIYPNNLWNNIDKGTRLALHIECDGSLPDSLFENWWYRFLFIYCPLRSLENHRLGNWRSLYLTASRLNKVQSKLCTAVRYRLARQAYESRIASEIEIFCEIFYEEDKNILQFDHNRYCCCS